MIKLPRNPNLTELAYRSVKDLLLSGKLCEGSRLTEESIATQLGISKSPVREALNRLESEGLICIESRRGAYVRTFSFQEIRNLYDLREVLEVHAVGSVKITPEFLKALAESVERTKNCLEEDDRSSHVDEDIRFHCLIAAATENEELYRLLENIQQKSLLCRYKAYPLSARAASASHNRIYQALKAGDRRGAQLAMQEHILFVRDSLLHSLETSDLELQVSS
jgi:DNA-binding GntR family transcriptional regulator